MRDQERKEKSSQNIEKMPADFVAQLQEYLQRKIAKNDGSSEGRREIENIKHTIQRLLETREHKILDAVMYASRTGLKPDNLNEKEQKMFDVILKEINEYRDEFLKSMERNKPKEGDEGGSKPSATVSKFSDDVQKSAVLKSSVKKYLVKRDVSRFVTPSLKERELKKGDILKENELEKTLNDLLLKRGIIEPTK